MIVSLQKNSRDLKFRQWRILHRHILTTCHQRFLLMYGKLAPEPQSDPFFIAANTSCEGFRMLQADLPKDWGRKEFRKKQVYTNESFGYGEPFLWPPIHQGIHCMYIWSFLSRLFEQIYDLKGSTRNRHVQSTGRENEVLLDENLVESKYVNP